MRETALLGTYLHLSDRSMSTRGIAFILEASESRAPNDTSDWTSKTMSGPVQITLGRPQLRTLCFGLALIVTAILSISLELLGNGSLILTGLPSL